jgi:hypothetical protein
MAIFDEYKQAVQDVLDGRAKEPSLPFAFSDEGDILAALYAAAAALSLSKEAPGGGGSGGGAEPLILHKTQTPVSGGTKVELDKTAGEIYTAFMSGKQLLLMEGAADGEYYLYPVVTLRVKNEYVSLLYINKSVINADFYADGATTKPYYIVSSGSND